MSQLKLERRHLERVEIRAASDGKPTMLVGYAAVFNSRSQDLGGFVEQIAPGAFTETLKAEDVRALYNHDDGKPLGRTKSRTLRLFEDATGLAYECDLPDVSYARDLVELVDRGDQDGCSFGFYVEDDELEQTEGELPLRTLKRVRLREVSLGVTWPAYTDTTLSLRSLSAQIQVRLHGTPRLDWARRTLELLDC